MYTEVLLEDHAHCSPPWQSRSRDPEFHVSKQWLNHVGDPAIDGEREKKRERGSVGLIRAHGSQRCRQSMVALLWSRSMLILGVSFHIAGQHPEMGTSAPKESPKRSPDPVGTKRGPRIWG